MKPQIGPSQPVFVIAEIGINHNGNFATAKELILQAHMSGASAAKLQTYITEKRVPRDSPIYGILKQCELSFDQQRQLFDYGRELGVEVFSTPFDEESVDFLDSIGVNLFKIASFDIVNQKLLKKVSEKRKPVIVSRGMATQAEVDRAMELFRHYQVEPCLLHCVSAYPVTDHRDLNLSSIRELRDRYDIPTGFSDHTLGIDVPPVAVAAGAMAIEKHFTLSRQASGPDHSMSVEPQEMKEMISRIRWVHEAMGVPVTGPVPSEKEILQYRRAS